jgi:NAD(P)-dependent dehydrogenase (short-subunit alcohol dehydrogenase family)
MRQSTRLGSIIMVSSTSGLRGKANTAAYCASKGGVRMLGKSVALHLAAEGGRIRCNIVFPGTVDTPMVRRSLGVSGESPEDMDKVIRGVAGIPMGHVGEADDIAHAVVYLASDESKYVTGAEIVIDGGRTAA